MTGSCGKYAAPLCMKKQNFGQGVYGMKETITLRYDTVVCGGGVAGVCAAVAAARHGLKTALIQNRSVLGGNGSSEMTININGAAYDGNSPSVYAAETGIVQELKLMMAHYGDRDIAFYELVYGEENLTLYLETQADQVVMGENRIEAVQAHGLMDEREYLIYGDVFIDCTGDGTVGALAGVPYMRGREAEDEFHESLAPKQGDNTTMGHSIILFADDMGEKVEFHRPAFAYDITKTEFFKDMQKPESIRRIPDYRGGRYVGFWWVEYGGQVDTIDDHGDITLELRKIVYGIWDYIKNSGKFQNVDNLKLTYVTPIAGKRESRRFRGDYILTQNDIDAKKVFDDSVCTGGWAMDIHAPHGIYDNAPATVWNYVAGMYEMPFSMLYSTALNNFMFAGRNASATHAAFGSARVQATGGVEGQAVGTAAYLCKKYGISPQEVRQKHIGELQELLLRDDQTILGRDFCGNVKLENKMQITAENRSYENAAPEGVVSLEREYMLALPVVGGRLDSISVGVKNSGGKTSLKVKLYQGSRPENYIPETCVGECETEIDAGFDDWLILNLNARSGEDGKVYIEFCKNDTLSLYATDKDISGAVTFLKGNRLSTDAHYASEYQYRRIQRFHNSLKNICFKDVAPDMSEIYAAKNLTDGMSRPYGLPNMWSAPLGESLTFTAEEPVCVESMELVFDTELDKDFVIDKMPASMIRDYDLTIFSPDGDEKIEVRDNFKRVQKHLVGKAVTKAVFTPLRTYGSEFVNLYAVRLFSEER